jgi:hypothetical protein
MMLLAIGILALAFVAWERALTKQVSDLLLRLFLATCGTLVQLTAGLTLLGWIGALHLVWACLLQVGVSLLILWFGRTGNNSQILSSTAESVTHTDRWALIAMILGTLPFALRMIFYASTLTPYDYDGLTYHLPPLVEALHAGRFVVSDVVSVYGNSYPKSVEMVYLWFLLTRSPQLLLFGQMLFLPMGILAIALTARRIGFSTPLALA